MLIAPFKSAYEVARSVATILRPPRRIKPSEAVNGSLRNDRDVLDISVAPYLIEPLDRFADRTYQGIVFVGPARTGKTFVLAMGGIYYIVTVAPADVLAIYMSQDTARDFSRLEVDRAIKHTPELAALLSPRARDDNTYDKFFRNGIALKIGWPAATQLRGKTVRYVLLMDYDGASTSDVDGRGSMWGQAFKRIETFMSRGKCMAESSPGFEYDDPNWVPRTAHEAPPARGIAAIYNSGTRARYYWRCQHHGCGQHFQSKPGLDVFAAPAFDEVLEAVQKHDLMMLAESFAKVPCPHCGGLHEPHQRSDLNAIRRDGDRVLGASWVHDGQQLIDCRLEGEPRRTNIASYWLGGAAAAYQSWVGLMHTYLSAVATYARNGDEADMRRSSFEDQAWPYLPMALRRRRSSQGLSGRLEHWEPGTVPEGVRFLTAAVDVQSHAFVVHVFGWGVGLESWLIDRFRITASRRPEGDRFEAIDPASYLEDWYELIDQVIERGYECVEAPGFMLMPRRVFGDSGGSEGVTSNGYQFWRHLKARYADRLLHKRYRLVKGDGNPNALRIKLTYPDTSNRKDRQASRGDVPVLRLNTNQFKDGIAGDLAREIPGPGYCHLPDWIDDGYFSEITAERRTAKGWVRDGHTANEAFDLHVYNRAACVYLNAEKIDWANPPEWAAPIPEQAARAKAAAATPAPLRRAVRRVRSRGVRL